MYLCTKKEMTVWRKPTGNPSQLRLLITRSFHSIITEWFPGITSDTQQLDLQSPKNKFHLNEGVI